jgi:Zn finger protein HypA/HybF involved in hydrogenase expression
LRGAHQAVECRACHTGRVFEEAVDTGCNGCHAKDDVHKGQQGAECAGCHNETGWTAGIFFDHDLTRFPLLGLHAVSACEQCHLSSRYKETSLECSSCHEADDVHLRRLGSGCEGCHNPNGWQLWRFDHETQTNFSLRGAHEDIDCHACHKVATDGRVRLAADCGECHARDDRHLGAFGRDCGRCHGAESWRDVRL